MSIIEKLFYGGIQPFERTYPKGSPYAKAVHLRNRKLEGLIEKLGEEEKKSFENYRGLQSEAERFLCCDMFSYGLKLGVMLTAEAFIGRGEITGGE
jgi:hypothetical protein